MRQEDWPPEKDGSAPGCLSPFAQRQLYTYRQGISDAIALETARDSPLSRRTARRQKQTNAEKLEEAGLMGLFSKESLDGKRAAAVVSLTGKAMEEARFQEKDVDILVPLGMEHEQEALLKWVHSLGIGWTCRKGYKGLPNQDSFFLLAVEDQFVVAGVFDGHGDKGHHVSQFARHNFLRNFAGHPLRLTDVREALGLCIEQCQEQLKEASASIGAEQSGCTASVVFVDLVSKRLSVAHVGDSRAVLAYRPGAEAEFQIVQTLDHMCEVEAEKTRIESASPPGRVVATNYGWRVMAQNSKSPGLNMSRVLGDLEGHRTAGLSCSPDTSTIDLEAACDTNEPVSLLLCSDGVWQYIGSRRAMKIVSGVQAAKEASGAVRSLALESWSQWMSNSRGKVCDDITALLVRVDLVGKAPSEAATECPSASDPLLDGDWVLPSDKPEKECDCVCQMPTCIARDREDA